MGKWGSGKTLSAVKHIKEITDQYTEITLITNVEIREIKTEKVIYFTNCEELIKALKQIDINNNKGYLIFIDEIHVVLSELFGRTNPTFLQFLSQQRKLSIHIIGTTQMFNKLPKFIRDYLMQSGNVIICKNILKIIQINKKVDMENIKENSKGQLEYKKAKIEVYLHTKELYQSYDTYAVIEQIKDLLGERKLENEFRLSNNIKSISEQ